MLDFTSALNLGLEHPASSLPAWTRLTLGKPAALAELDATAHVERRLAELVGCEAAVLGTSTLHLFWDLFTVLAPPGGSIFLDAGSYPIARWGAERAAAAGARVANFAHYDANTLRALLARAPRARPVVVTDGFCPSCGRAAPLAEYTECATAAEGLVVVDDTQALGILGRSPATSPPYGSGGGGSLRRLARQSAALVVVSSLAKALGAPVAMLGGSERLVTAFRQSSATRVYCSPPSSAVLAAAARALEINGRCGDALRRRLAGRVGRFRAGLAQLDLLAVPGDFPVQPVRLPVGTPAGPVHQELLRAGVRAVLVRESFEGPARVRFVLTAQHELSEIDRALDVLADTLARASFENWKGAKYHGVGIHDRVR